MPSPFPGMDPYLERPGVWPGFHRWLIMTLAQDLGARLRPRYWVSVEERTYIARPEDYLLVGIPDATVIESKRAPAPQTGSVATLARGIEVGVPLPEEVRERYLEIRVPRSQDVVTVVEILSPANKRPGNGREDYLLKRERTLSTRTNLVEIALLRAGHRMPMLRPPESYDYGILVCRGAALSRAVLYPIGVQDSLPSFPLPLRKGEDDVAVPLADVFARAYDSGNYDLILDYHTPPDPPLSGADAEWAAALLARRHA
jgi:hypothetical protein